MTACDPLELEILPPYIGSAVSPTVDITETSDDVTVTITDINGEHSYTIEKTEIALASDAELSSIAAVENATASANYAVGSYLVHAGILYRVTTAIATGETITPGSNVTATTVMAEIIRLTA